MKAQGSVEALGLLGGLVIVLLAITIFLPQQQSEIGLERNRAIALQSAQAIATAADDVYLAGDGAQKSVSVEFPDGYDASRSYAGNKVDTGNIFNNRTIGIYVIGAGEITAESRAPVCGTLPNASGEYRITLYYNASGHVMVNASC